MLPVKDNIPSGTVPLITVGLIVANVVVYILSIRHGGGFFSGPDVKEVFKYGTIPDALSHGGAHCTYVASAHPLTACAPRFTGAEPLVRLNTVPTGVTLFTALFLHASLVHLAGNMLFLWIFGNSVEQSLGRVRYLLLYLVSGIAALALQVALTPHSAAPTLGSSGAVAGVLGAYLVLYPRGKVLAVVVFFLCFTVIELPLWLMLGAWIAEQAAFGATNLITPAGGRNAVAYFAYIGGFAFGLLIVKLLARYFHPPQPPAVATA